MARHGDEAVEAPVAGESPAHTPEDFGSPLPTVLRGRMEELLDVPLKDVRVFRNSAAQAATHDHGADALAVGTDVHLASGQGDPSTPSGEALLAHELSHVAAALRGRRESLHAEEQQAQAIEHRIKTQTVLEVARQPRQAPGPPLEHRTQPRSHAVPTTTTFAAPSYSGGGFAGGSNGTAGGSGAPTAMAAPVGRITGTADVSQGSGGVGGYMGTASDTNLMDPRAEEPDEPGGGIERIVDAVMRRLRREGSFERERRGSFRSEIGG
jgi:hypothetical protein